MPSPNKVAKTSSGQKNHEGCAGYEIETGLTTEPNSVSAIDVAT